MLEVIIIYGIISTVSIVSLLIIMFSSPLGKEDEQGFHVVER